MPSKCHGERQKSVGWNRSVIMIAKKIPIEEDKWPFVRLIPQSLLCALSPHPFSRI